jgi:hypothetical protein
VLVQQYLIFGNCPWQVATDKCIMGLLAQRVFGVIAIIVVKVKFLLFRYVFCIMYILLFLRDMN